MMWRAVLLVVVVAGGCKSSEGPKLANYHIGLTNVPMCADHEKNALERTIIVRAGTDDKQVSEWGIHGGYMWTPGQVRLGGPSDVQFKFGVCPANEGGKVGCEADKIVWYADKVVPLDPAKLAVVGKTAPDPSKHPTVEVPWPPGAEPTQMKCWTGAATASPVPL